MTSLLQSRLASLQWSQHHRPLPPGSLKELRETLETDVAIYGSQQVGLIKMSRVVLLDVQQVFTEAGFCDGHSTEFRWQVKQSPQQKSQQKKD